MGGLDAGETRMLLSHSLDMAEKFARSVGDGNLSDLPMLVFWLGAADGFVRRLGLWGKA